MSSGNICSKCGRLVYSDEVHKMTCAGRVVENRIDFDIEIVETPQDEGKKFPSVENRRILNATVLDGSGWAPQIGATTSIWV